MASFDTTRPSASFAGGLDNIFGNLLAAFVDWNTNRSVRRELLNMTDRELDDIGLNRADIYKMKF